MSIIPKKALNDYPPNPILGYLRLRTAFLIVARPGTARSICQSLSVDSLAEFGNLRAFAFGPNEAGLDPCRLSQSLGRRVLLYPFLRVVLRIKSSWNVTSDTRSSILRQAQVQLRTGHTKLFLHPSRASRSLGITVLDPAAVECLASVRKPTQAVLALRHGEIPSARRHGSCVRGPS